MGSDCRVLLYGPRTIAQQLAALVGELERKWSRFRSSSEVSQLNARSGMLTVVSPETFLLVERSIEAWRMTRGAFDPTLLADLVRAGYDRSFEQLAGRRDDQPTGDAMPTRAHPPPACDAIELFEAIHGVVLPVGTSIDPGGIGKGLAADLAADAALAAGASGVAVDIGGDVRVAGANGEDGEWSIVVEDPRRPGQGFATVQLASGAIATSSPLRRRWRAAGQERHHLLDPVTGDPVETPFAAVTAIASQGWLAEAVTKQIFVESSAFAATPHGTHVIALRSDGTIQRQSTHEEAA